MAESFIQDARGRLSVYALQSQLQIQIFKKSQSLKAFGFESQDTQSWFVFLVMTCLMRQSLATRDNDGISLEDLAWLIQDMIKTEYDFVLEPDQYLQLARLVVVDILCNGGVPIYYKTGTNPPLEVPLTYLTSPTKVVGGQRIGVYRMAEDGYRLMLGTRELEDNLKTTVSAIIMQLKVEAKDYSSALEESSDVLDQLHIQEDKIRQAILQVKSDLLSISAMEARQMFQENIKIFEEAREKFQEIRSILNLHIKDTNEQLSVENLTENLQKNIDLMNKIDRNLQSSILVTGSILSALSDYMKARREEFFAQLGSRSLQSRSLRHDLFEPVIHNPDGLELLDQLLHPLFSKQPEPFFQLDTLLEIKQYHQSEEEEPEEYAQETQDEAADLRLEKRLEDVRIMHDLFQAFIQDLQAKPDRKLDLASFVQENPVLASYRDARLIKELLASWSMQMKLDIQDLLKQEQELDIGVETLYSLPLSYLQAARQMEALKAYAWLHIEKAPGKVSLQVEDNSLPCTITIDNLQMRLERKQL